jgi:hypothetical protein
VHLSKIAKLLIVGLCLVVLSGCISTQPRNTENICDLFSEKPKWYKASVKAAKKWKSNVSVPMAIMAQESAFKARAKPRMQYFLGIVPYGRPSSAFGYSQALDSTWASYKKQAGSVISRRDNFGDAVDFIQWYMNATTLRHKIPKTDGYKHYLNYHEGQGGYARGTYKNKTWLINTAKRVDSRAKLFDQQYKQCSAKLKKNNRWSLF